MPTDIATWDGRGQKPPVLSRKVWPRVVSQQALPTMHRLTGATGVTAHTSVQPLAHAVCAHMSVHIPRTLHDA